MKIGTKKVEEIVSLTNNTTVTTITVMTVEGNKKELWKMKNTNGKRCKGYFKRLIETNIVYGAKNILITLILIVIDDNRLHYQNLLHYFSNIV